MRGNCNIQPVFAVYTQNALFAAYIGGNYKIRLLFKGIINPARDIENDAYARLSAAYK